MISSNENIELYLRDNVPNYLPNSSLKDLSPIINTSYKINNMNFTVENNDKIELYHINEKRLTQWSAFFHSYIFTSRFPRSTARAFSAKASISSSPGKQ